MPKKHAAAPGPRKPPVRAPAEDRDPNHINDQLKFGFYHVFGEPYGTRSADCTWEFSRTFYDCFIGFIYKLITFFTAPCIASWWGCEFAIIAFQHVWCITPCFKCVEIVFSLFTRIFRSCMRCCIYPPCRAFGHIFILFRKEGINDEEDDNPFYHLQKAPVRKTRIIQTPSRKNKVAPEKAEKPNQAKKKEVADPNVMPGVVAISVANEIEDPEDYLGEKANMVNAIKRQMLM
ncbi:caveolin-3-like [Saccostrea cucullata]|uniref:caveolin-3-like n=1 Tax=Saccostrea cuccullata TaxID=36930 RepID=UPI002ED00301